MKKKAVNFYFISCCMLCSFNLLAQPGDTDGTPTDNLEGTDPAASINHFLVLLILLGLAIGVKAVRLSVKTEKGNCSNS